MDYVKQIKEKMKKTGGVITSKESIVDKIIIGGTNDDGEIDPAMITIIYKTGKKDSQDGRLFKSRRKNAKVVDEKGENKLCTQSSDEVNSLCSYSTDNTCGVRGTVVQT